MKIVLLALSSILLQICALKERSKEEMLSCQQFMNQFDRGMWSIQGPRKCLNETYSFGHQLEKFRDECQIEPVDESLSYYDSTWIYYHCIVQKTIGTKPLTLKTYANMMSEGLSAPTKAAIISVLNKNQAKYRIKSTEAAESVSARVDNMRKYWKYYFDAEFEVCTNSSMNTCSDSLKTQQKRVWIPEITCPVKSREIPQIADDITWSDLARKESYKCLDRVKGRHVTTPSTSYAVDMARFSWCNAIADGFFEKQDENTPLDFDLLYNKWVARKYYSKSVKRQAFRAFRKEFSKRYATYNESIAASTTVKEIISYANEQLDAKLKEAGHTEENMILLKNVDVLKSLLGSRVHVRSNLCELPETKMERP